MKTSIAWPHARLCGELEPPATFVLPRSESARCQHGLAVGAVILNNCAASAQQLLAAGWHDNPSNIFGAPLGAQAKVSRTRIKRASRPSLAPPRSGLFFGLSYPRKRGSLKLLDRWIGMVDDRVTKLHFALGTRPLAIARKEK
jgi:hypothetical protein